MTWSLSSSAFTEGASIPRQYTCDGADWSPPLAWGDPPQGTKSLALIVADPDAPLGTWVHWVAYNIPPQARGLSEHVSTNAKLPDGSVQGMNDFGRVGYGGPCPPAGAAHRYVFTLYALDAPSTLAPRATKAQLEEHITHHLLGQTQLIGRYQR